MPCLLEDNVRYAREEGIIIAFREIIELRLFLLNKLIREPHMKLKLQALNCTGGERLLVGSSVTTELDRLMIAMDLIMDLNGPKNWRLPSCTLAPSMSLYNLLWRMPYSAG
jgi:hypothetical protein